MKTEKLLSLLQPTVGVFVLVTNTVRLVGFIPSWSPYVSTKYNVRFVNQKCDKFIKEKYCNLLPCAAKRALATFSRFGLTK